MERLSDERLAEIEAVDEVKRAREVYRVERCTGGDPDAEDESAATWQQPYDWCRGSLEWCRGYVAAQRGYGAWRFVRESDGKVAWE